MHVSRTFGDDPDHVGKELHLLPLDGAEPGVVFRFDVGADSDGEVFEALGAIHGGWTEAPRFAVYGDWEVDREGDPTGFEASRLELSGLRRTHIDTFHTDYLLKRLSRPGSYTVLGLYGDEEGLRLCREHPAIRDWARNKAPAQWRAQDTSGVRLFRIAEARL